VEAGLQRGHPVGDGSLIGTPSAGSRRGLAPPLRSIAFDLVRFPRSMRDGDSNRRPPPGPAVQLKRAAQLARALAHVDEPKPASVDLPRIAAPTVIGDGEDHVAAGASESHLDACRRGVLVAWF
jgi:hypothetical protein